MIRSRLMVPAVGLLLLLICSGCGWVSWPGWLSRDKGPSYNTSLKLKIAVLPFENQAGPIGLEMQEKTVELLSKDLAKTKRFIVVSRSEMEAYLKENQIATPLTQNTAAMIGRALSLNTLIMGSISEVSQVQKRVGWFYWMPFLVKPKDLIQVVLVARAIDTENSATLVTTTATGITKTGLSRDDILMGNPSQGVEKKIVHSSVEKAVEQLADELRDTLKKAAWKGYIRQVSGTSALLAAGSEVGIKAGDRFVVLASEEKITNAAGQMYVIPGPVKASLEAVKVSPNTTDLKIVNGEVHFGEAVWPIK